VLALGALGFACWTRIQTIQADSLAVGHYLGPVSGVSEDGRGVAVPDSDCHLLRYGSSICPACRSDRKEWAALKEGLLAKGCDVTEFAPAAELLEPGSPRPRSFRLKLLDASFVARSRFRATPTMVLANRSWRVVWSQVGSLQGPELNSILGREPEPLAIALLRPVELHLRPLPSARAQSVTAPPADASLDERTVVLPVAGSPMDGPADARVTVVEFADFQCPFCARASGPLRKLRTQFPSDVRLIYKHFPLDMHPLARPAAGLSVLAARSGRFWTVYAALFQASPSLSPDAVREAARQAGLDWDHLSPALDSPEVRQRIDADIALGKSVGLEGTPTLFVNGRQYRGAIDSANLERVVLGQLGRPESSRESGGGTQR
jgi:protein-disulfide isomerase